MRGLEGRTLGDFSLQRLLGQGGMADVYLAYDARAEREVAVKVFRREDEEMLRRFLREARLMASLHHPHLMPIYTTGTALLDGMERYYIVMPYMPGGTLRSFIRKSPLSLSQICAYLTDLASALDYIHSRGIIHRDIKSSNVLLSSKGSCYLADFGIARNVSDATQMTSTGNVLGTVDYVAPELFEPDHKADARSDFYSLGVLLYEMVTGRMPFIGESQLAIVTMHVGRQPPLPSAFVPDLPVPVEQVILKALAKNPDDRYPSARALADAFCQAARAPRYSGSSEERENLFLQIQEKPARSPSEKGPLVLSTTPRDRPPTRLAPLDEATLGFHQSTSPVSPQTGRPASPARKRGRILTALAFLAILAVLVPAISLVVHPNLFSPNIPATSTAQGQQTLPTATPTQIPTATPNLTATAHAVSLAATANAVHATETAIAGITATAVAQARATVGVVQTAVAQPPLYPDPLTNVNNPFTRTAQWDSDTHNCIFRPDGYHVLTGLIAIKGCREKHTMYGNSAMSVDMQLVSGSTGGIFFHINTDFANDYSGYLFEVDAQGNYRLSSSDNYTTSYPTQFVLLKSGKVPTGWNAGFQVKNTLELIVQDGTINLYANTVYLASVTDTTYLTGTFGFASSQGADQAQGEVIYSNLKVYP